MIINKIRAFGIHAAFTFVAALLTSAVVFYIWYPGDLARMVNGAEIYLIVLGVEIVLGPVMSLIIYNTNKPKKELFRDYMIIALIQISALAYGMYSVALSRPVFLVFVKDRIEVVAAVELKQEDLEEAKDFGFNKLSWFGPKLVCAEFPTDKYEKSDLLLSALAGKDIQLIPSYFRECKAGQIYNKSYTKEELFSKTSITEEKISPFVKAKDYKWLPVVTRFGSWLVVYFDESLDKATYIDEDPFQ
ncbi:MAG: hypothetical protein ACRBCS_01230 [Cellvibrionaceae bacterium]